MKNRKEGLFWNLALKPAVTEWVEVLNQFEQVWTNSTSFVFEKFTWLFQAFRYPSRPDQIQSRVWMETAQWPARARGIASSNTSIEGVSLEKKNKNIFKHSKGQLISKCRLMSSFGPKYQGKNWQISALESKKWWNQQNKGTF